MSELISGKDALIALANGRDVQKKSGGGSWLDVSQKEHLTILCFLSGVNSHGDSIDFRLKPKTIIINGVEVPAPFEPKDNEVFFFLNSYYESGYDSRVYSELNPTGFYHNLAWRTEEDINQVVNALRLAFKPK